MARRYAPEGIYFLTEETTVRLKTGLMGVLAGTQVKMLKDTGDTVRVTDGKEEFDVKKSQLTNDIDIAAAIQNHAQATEAAGDKFRAQQNAIYEKQQRDHIEFLRTHPLATPTPTPSPGR